MLRTIKLRGHLGKKFGKEYKFDVSSAAEAVKALCHQVKGFKEYMQDGNGKDQKFKVVVNEVPLSEVDKTLKMQSTGDISIVPVIKGSGGDFGNVFQVVLGAALVGAAFGLFGPGAGAFLGEFGISYATAGWVGGALLFSGVIGSLLKPPQMPNPMEKSVDQNRSYLFNGAVNTVQQGQPIPIGYGKLKIGSQVVSANVSTAQVPV